LQDFFPSKFGGVMQEVTCEPSEQCNNNEVLFKGLFSWWLAYTALLVPTTYDTILPKLETSVQAAAKSCSGLGNNTCGVRWYMSKYDGMNGMEQQIAASNIFSSYLVKYEHSGNGPVTSTTGGDSKSNPNAGAESNTDKNKAKPVTSGDKAGAGILTVIMVASWAGLIAFVLIGG
jgi:mannan endo-1,6-alpha-mannosidase